MASIGQRLRQLSSQRKWLIPTVLGLFVVAFFWVSHFAKPRFFEQISDLHFDQLQRQYPREYNPDTPVRIIDIDDESIKRLGQWPWPRTVLAKMNHRLADAGVAVIAYDILFAEPDRTSPENIVESLRDNPQAHSILEQFEALQSHDAVFAESFNATRIVTGFFLDNQDRGSLPATKAGFSYGGEPPLGSIPNYSGAQHALPGIEAAADGIGHVTVVPDRDTLVRQAPLIGRVGDQIYPALSIEALRVAQDVSTITIYSSNATRRRGAAGNKNTQVASVRVGNEQFEVPTTADGKMIMHYTKPVPEQRFVPAWQVLSDDPADSGWQDRVAGQIIFVGTSSLGLKDIRATPMQSNAPGVVVHAQVAEQIIEQKFLFRPYDMIQNELLIIFILGVALAFLLPRLNAAWGIVVTLILAGAVYWGSVIAFKDHSQLFNPVYILLMLLTLYVLITLASFYLTESERSRIRNAFSMYLSPTMVKRVSDDPGLLTLGGEERMITTLFLDVRSFSKISESMRPQDITTFLNKFLTPMTDIMQDHKATIDKYIGDAIVAFWNAPLDDDEHEKNAARSILAMQNSLDQLNQEYQNQSEIRWPDEVKMGIGINTGICCVGNLGSEQRFSYSMIGDAANLASRIEGLTKQYGLSNLIGSKTAEALDGFALLQADSVAVVGRETPEDIFMLMGNEETANSESFKVLRKGHDEFLKAYRGRKWKAAIDQSKVLAAGTAEFPIQDYYAIMAERIKAYKTSPPPKDWNGVYRAQSK